MCVLSHTHCTSVTALLLCVVCSAHIHMLLLCVGSYALLRVRTLSILSRAKCACSFLCVRESFSSDEPQTYSGSTLFVYDFMLFQVSRILTVTSCGCAILPVHKIKKVAAPTERKLKRIKRQSAFLYLCIIFVVVLLWQTILFFFFRFCVV